MFRINYIKSPLNWVGNKYKYLDVINDIIKDKKYEFVIDMFLGSGNILLNINNATNKYIGIDKNKLVPKLYTELAKYTYSYDEQEQIINKFSRFSKKEDYYVFRDYWNRKYLLDEFDKDFIYETVLLLKMCSNSMVRFNPKEGYFNQGFRGLGSKKEFFTEEMKNQCIDRLNELNKNLNNKYYKFIGIDFVNILDNLKEPNNLLILDPPYILRSDMYDTDFTKEHDKKLLKLISNTKNDFIYFNYLIRDGVVNEELNKIIINNDFWVIDINNKTLSGQGRSENIKEVKEVIVTNVCL